MKTLPHAGILTGAAGGMGRDIALELAALGVHLVITDLDPDALAALEKEASALPGDLVAVPGDLRDPLLAGKLVDTANTSFGAIELLVNCSGYLKDSRFQKMPIDLFDTLIEINLLGPLRLIDAVLPIMREHGFGRVISLSSRAWLGNFGSSGYSAAKGGIVGATRSLALHNARHGITLNCVAPGFIDTPMANSLPPHIRKRVIEAIPVGRTGTVSEIARLVTFLADQRNGYITGQTLVACGGRSISDPIAKSGERE